MPSLHIAQVKNKYCKLLVFWGCPSSKPKTFDTCFAFETLTYYTMGKTVICDNWRENLFSELVALGEEVSR